MIHAYSPTNDAGIESKDDFYEQLEGTVQKCNRNDILIIIGDLNAKVGKGTPEERERYWDTTVQETGTKMGKGSVSSAR